MNPLSKKFKFIDIILFSVPNIIMMIFMSLYVIVDGMFISRYAGTLALSAQNMSYPIICIELAIGIMLGSGSSAIIAKEMGEGNNQKAKEDFTFIIFVSFLTGVIIAVFCNLFLDEILVALGTNSQQFQMCKEYTRILVAFAPAMFLQTVFQTLFVTAGRPQLGLLATFSGGFANIILDYVFVAVLKMGMNGAAYATVIGYILPSLIGIIYFTFNRKGTLYFIKFKSDLKMLLNSCTNGLSEMVSNTANAVTTFLLNIIFLKYYGVDGVASITIVLYFQFLFGAVFWGFSMGVAPVFSYKYGKQDIPQIKSVFRYCLIFIVISSILAYILSLISVRSLLMLFTSHNMKVFNLTMNGFPKYALSFLLMSIGIFASSMFTAFSNGRVSAIISLCRTFIFLAGSLIIIPNLIGAEGAWWATPVAELLGVIVSVYYIIKNRKVYKY